VISDYDMPGRNGVEFLEAVRESHPELPFVLFTGKGSEEVASDAISAGVTDYLQKEVGSDQYTVLANRVANAVEHRRSRQLVERSGKRLREIIDSLPHLLYVVDEAGTYVLANEALAEFHGMAVGDIEGAHVEDVLGEDLGGRFRRSAEEVLDSGTERRFPEREITDADGETHVFEPQLLPYDLADEGRAVLGVATDVTARRERERELERYGSYLEKSSDLITLLDESGAIEDESPAVARVLGYEPGELVGRNAFEFVHPDDAERVRSAFDALLADAGTTETVECRFRTADGGHRWLDIRGTNQLDNAAIGGVVVNARDATERKRRETELERASDLLDRTERVAAVGGWEVDAESREVFWTDNLLDLLGIEGGGTPTLDDALSVYHHEDRPAVEAAVESALADAEPFDLEVRSPCPEGGVRWVRVQGVPTVEDGEVVAVRGAVQNVTDQRRRERELEQARAEYEELLDGMNDTVWVTGDDGDFLAVNDAAVETLGYSRAELLSMGPQDIDAALGDEEITALIEGMPEDGLQVFETVHETKAGERIPVEISSTMITYRGEPAIVSIGRDISGRKRREERLSEFASVASHDLRNPLNVAQGRLAMARRERDSENLAAVSRAHDRMDELIGDLLALSRSGEGIGEAEPVGLAGLARECWRNVDTGDATLSVAAERTVRADRSRLQQLLENLFRNAVEHGATDNETGLTVTVGDLGGGFYVADDGAGLPGAGDIFETGYSAAEDGTGFGLAIVERVADAHGWTVDALDDGGARFEVSGDEFVE
jgi:PAS domain S-box-containing protein